MFLALLQMEQFCSHETVCADRYLENVMNANVYQCIHWLYLSIHTYVPHNNNNILHTPCTVEGPASNSQEWSVHETTGVSPDTTYIICNNQFPPIFHIKVGVENIVNLMGRVTPIKYFIVTYDLYVRFSQTENYRVLHQKCEQYE